MLYISCHPLDNYCPGMRDAAWEGKSLRSKMVSMNSCVLFTVFQGSKSNRIQLVKLVGDKKSLSGDKNNGTIGF